MFTLTDGYNFYFVAESEKDNLPEANTTIDVGNYIQVKDHHLLQTYNAKTGLLKINGLEHRTTLLDKLREFEIPPEGVKVVKENKLSKSRELFPYVKKIKPISAFDYLRPANLLTYLRKPTLYEVQEHPCP